MSGQQQSFQADTPWAVSFILYQFPWGRRRSPPLIHDSQLSTSVWYWNVGRKDWYLYSDPGPPVGVSRLPWAGQAVPF